MQVEPVQPRKIIHFDMDAFYAAVEIRDRPDLHGKPLVIGGSPQSRSVVCTASYEARRYGIRSAMPCAHAFRLCPQAIFLKPDFSKYRQASEQVHAIFRDYTDLIEPLSLDEAYLDVTHDDQKRYATRIAHEIQARIADELGLSGSAGVAPNKMVAKIASDFRKPFGITVVQPHQIRAFIGPLSLRKIPGIGPASERRLASLGYQHCQDLWQVPLTKLKDQLGENMGQWLYWRAQGVDHRQVQVSRQRKSIGLERTFASDLSDRSELEAILDSQLDELLLSLEKRKLWARTWTLKVKYFDFKQSTRSKSVEAGVQLSRDSLQRLFLELLDKTEAGPKAIRLLGVSASNLIG